MTKVQSMFTTLERWSPEILSLTRIAFGITFVEHGTQKLFSFPLEPVAGLGPGMLLFVGLLETTCGALVALGLFTRIAAFLLSGEMAIGYWALHAPRSAYPILNGGEIMVLYSFAFLYFAAKGPGPWSLDAKLRAA
jgi:putative oxidoreductase